MGVGKVGGGGRKGSVGGASGGGKATGAGKASGATFGKVDKYEKLVGPSGAAGSSNVGATGATGAADPVTAKALEIAAQLKSGQIKTREEATKKLVAQILHDRVRMKSKLMEDRISREVQDDPELQQMLERLWAKAE